MALDKSKIQDYARRLILSRMRILANNGFYGLLLTHLQFNLDETCSTASTDGKKIYFGPQFLDNISDEELDFILMHEILHVVLQHCLRDGDRNHEIFNIACDIVVNSNIMHSWNDNVKRITLKNYGESMHLTPDDQEGYLFNAEEVYEMICDKLDANNISYNGSGSSGGQGSSSSSSSSQNNSSENNNQNSKGNQGNSSKNNQSQKGQSSQGGQASQGQQKSKGAQGAQGGQGGSSASAQNAGSSGSSGNMQPNGGSQGTNDGGGFGGFFDDHSRWENLSEDEKAELRDAWEHHLNDAINVISIEDPSNSRGTLPLFAERILKNRGKSQTDWRTVLNNFIQDEINDYSFSPPDRRFSDSDFFLPDFNEKDETIKDILFMIDTSASIDDLMIAYAYEEIRGAIEQFNGKLKGWLGFFDAAVIPPIEFSTIDELEIIKPRGGGGTDFHVIFDYVKHKMEQEPPSHIIILTDGYAPFPKESEALGIPVLWVINNEDVTPPWGKITRIKVDTNE